MSMVYISGKITGDENYKEKFNKAQERINELFPYHSFINPAEVNLPKCCGWADYMEICLKLLSRCNSIVMLPDFRESKGAMIELQYAKAMGIAIYYYDGHDIYY